VRKTFHIFQACPFMPHRTSNVERRTSSYSPAYLPSASAFSAARTTRISRGAHRANKEKSYKLP